MEASFVGVDLAWHGNGRNTGLAALRATGDAVRPDRFGIGASDLDGVVQFIQSNESQTTVVAIDAPLIIQNRDGQRPCETLVSQRFASAHASAHTTNLGRFPNADSLNLVRQLEGLGYRHCSEPNRPWMRAGRWFFEVYPHPAHVVLFERKQIIKYKKGSVANRRSGLAELRTELYERLITRDDTVSDNPALREYLLLDLKSLVGRHLKHYEDSLDAILCSFLAYYLWRWGWTKNEMIGDMTNGYIVVPTCALHSRGSDNA
jgi:predicted RNase H-like nuclease